MSLRAIRDAPSLKFLQWTVSGGNAEQETSSGAVKGF